MAKVRREIEPVKEKKEEKVIAFPPARGPALSKLSSVKGMSSELGKLYDELNLLLEQTTRHKGRQHLNIIEVQIEDKRKEIKEYVTKNNINLRELLFDIQK